jgi:putative FmdB family regulatory protein
MPIYEYKCQKCGEHFERRQSVSDEPLKVCEKCGGELEKQWSLSGFQFKGGGWYVTDYAGVKKGGKDSSGESTAKSDAASKPSGESPSTPTKKE